MIFFFFFRDLSCAVLCVGVRHCVRVCFLNLPANFTKRLPITGLFVCVFLRAHQKIHSTEREKMVTKMVAQMKLIGRGGGVVGGERTATDVAITARETRVCYVCPTKSSFKIDIKSTARSITKLYCGSCSFNLLQAHEKFSLRRSKAVFIRSSISLA